MAIITNNPNYLLIGLGGTGGKILKEFKKQLYREHPDDIERGKLIPAIEFLYVDSTEEMMNKDHKDKSWRVLGKDATFTQNEFLLIKASENSVSQILDNIDNYPGLRYIVKNGEAMRATLGQIGAAAGQKRRAGRIMFASNASRFLAAVEGKYITLRNRTKKDSLHVMIFTGLAGGTGSGSIIDAVCQIRKKYPTAEIDVYAMVPELNVPPKFDTGRYQQNGYAALRELSALNVNNGWRPSDVITGEEHIKFTNTEDDKKQFGLVLFSNVNENGIVVPTVQPILHRLVADTVYFTIFLQNNQNTQDYFRSWSCENRDDYLVEYSTKSKKGDLIPKRTKAVSTFGIKRIVYPESRIMEHISYTLSERIIWQMHYNNFKEEGEGFVNEPIHKDYSEFTKDEGKKREWRLDDSHLMLNEKILDTDKNFKTFDDFWKEVTTSYNYEEAKSNDPEPLRFLEQFCEDQYLHHFRLKQGVEDYYKDKSSDKVLREQAEYIVDAIERDLYTQWYEGKYSLADLMGICDEILDYLKKEIANSEKNVSHEESEIEACEEDREANNEEFNHASVFKRVIGGSSRIYSDHQQILQDLYMTKTRKVARTFEGKLLGRLRNYFEEFQAEVNEFIGCLLKAEDELVKEIADRTRKNSELDLQKTIVEVSEDEKMASFEKKIERDRTKMESLATIMRHELVRNQTYAHFGDLAMQMGDDVIEDIAEKSLAPQLKAYHDNDDDFRRDKIIGINVLQELQKLLNNNPQMDINTFAQHILEQCGVFLKLNNAELTKFMPNNPNPNSERASIDQKTLLITLPNYEGDDKLKAFAHQLESAFRAAASADSTTLAIDHSGTKNNEITIVEVRYLFPVRCLSWLPEFKSKYDKLVNSPNEAERKQNEILLHSEGDGRDLPQLEGEGDGPKGTELLAYYYLAVATGIMAWGQNAEGVHGWCYVKVDPILGTQEVKLISPHFTEIVESEEMTADIRSEIIDKVDELLKRKDLTVAQRKEIQKRVVIVVQKQVAKETSDTSTPKFKEYAAAAKMAIEKIQK